MEGGGSDRSGEDPEERSAAKGHRRAQRLSCVDPQLAKVSAESITCGSLFPAGQTIMLPASTLRITATFLHFCSATGHRCCLMVWYSVCLFRPQSDSSSHKPAHSAPQSA